MNKNNEETDKEEIGLQEKEINWEREDKFRYRAKIHRCIQMIEIDPHSFFEVESALLPTGKPKLSIIYDHAQKLFTQINFCPFCGKPPKPHKFDKETGMAILENSTEA